MLKLREYTFIIQVLMLIMFSLFGTFEYSYCQNQDTTILLALPDTTIVNETGKSSTTPKKKFLDSEVKYHAKDSIRFEISSKKVYLFGEAEVEYENIRLNANYIELDMNKKQVYATGIPDSSGQLVGKPSFDEGSQKFTSETMSYNFESKKGIINDVITQQSDGYIHGEKVKKMDNDIMYIKKGKYTTCDKPNPHFHLQIPKIKVIPNNKIVTGPAYLKFRKIPTPLALPFGFFPNKKGRASGILAPEPAYSQQLGVGIKQGGYYFGINDNMDLEFKGDAYSKGSWLLNSRSNYKKRYKYNGYFSAKYSNTITGFKELGYEPEKNFNLNWEHFQDPKARPNSSFSARINAGSRDFNKFNSVASNKYLENSFQSGVNYSKSFPVLNTPSTLVLNASHDQNTISKVVNITLPNVSWSLNRFYPFKKQNQVGSKKFYEKIGVSYSTNFKNQLSTYDSLLFNQGSENFKKMRNGMQHTVSVSTSEKVLKYFTLTPNFSYSERWYLQTINKKLNDSYHDSIVVDTDTITGFRRNSEASVRADVTTKIYGMYQFKGKRLKAIRHVITPSIGLGYKPGFNTERIINKTPYSPYQLGVFGYPKNNEQGNVNYSLMNNLEMKVRSAKDTITGFKKIKIFESFAFSGNHNLLADSFNWSTINMNARTNLLSKLDLITNTTLDPYIIDTDNKRINKLEWKENGRIARIQNSNLSIRLMLNSANNNKPNANEEKNSTEPSKKWYDMSVKWDFNIDYNVNYTPLNINQNYTQALTLNGNIGINEKWKFIVFSGYDFTLKEVSSPTVEIYRDLHCWEFNLKMVPYGANQSFQIKLGVKPGTLQDLKIDKLFRPNFNNL